MSIKLFTIGDSISQGFMSGAAANPQLSYNKLIADKMGLSYNNYSYLEWDEKYKTKVDLEYILRMLESKFGPDVSGWREWGRAIKKIYDFIDAKEDYFERGDGKLGNPVNTNSSFFHNVSVEGMDVSDAWKVTPKLCKEIVNNPDNEESYEDGKFIESFPFYRNAYRVLNPGGTATETANNKKSPIEWLNTHTSNQNVGVENLILWLGANNALGTVIDLSIKQTENDKNKLPMNMNSREEKSKFNLWHPNDFEAEYKELMKRVDTAMKKNPSSMNWKVFVGTVPFVTIAPIAKGVGNSYQIAGQYFGNSKITGQYYDNYIHFFMKEKTAKELGQYLTMRDAILIDTSIAKYNDIIKKLIKKYNSDHGSDRYFIVDTNKSLYDMAWRRNSFKPTYKYPKYFDFVHPNIDTKYYHVNKYGKTDAGGIFSLDGIHPTAIGQGLIAWEFLKEMKKAGVVKNSNLPWKEIFASDTLRAKPIKLMHELYEHDDMIKFLVKTARAWG